MVVRRHALRSPVSRGRNEEKTDAVPQQGHRAGWVDDYIVGHPTVSNVVSVLEKDFTPGPDSGLVVISLRNASTVTYIQPWSMIAGRAGS
jgi:hypothetical protein